MSEREKLAKALQGLVNKCSVATAYWRHHGQVGDAAMAALYDRQLEAESVLAAQSQPKPSKADEERAQGVLDDCFEDLEELDRCSHLNLKLTIASALAQERERCAKEAIECDETGTGMGSVIADAIRSLGRGEQKGSES